MGIRKTLCALILPLAIGLSGCANNNNEKNNANEKIVCTLDKPLVDTLSTFNKENNKFNQPKRGVSEDCLMKYINLGSIDADLIEYYHKVNEQERSIKFVKLGEYEGSISGIQMRLTAIENMTLIKEIDKTDIKQLKEEYVPLKKLIMELDKIDGEKISQLEKAEEMIRVISQSMESGKKTCESVGIEKLVNGELGDCNDLSPAYFAILNYYGIKTYMRSAAIVEDKNKTGLHAWVSVNAGGASFDLDPTWYDGFCPLKDRN